jgi:anthranilate/para-aminobenzoate synthase component II
VIGDGRGPRIAALDTGIKHSIVRNFTVRGATLELHPCTASADDLLASDPDGLFLVPGPGDPAALDYIVATIREVLARDRPVFGICLGHQLLSRAVGLETFKLPFGHRGANHPVKDLRDGSIAITSQNHGFAVTGEPGQRIASDLGEAEITHVNLYDGTVEGLRFLDVPAGCVQYHPEAGPGPQRLARALRRVHRAVRGPCLGGRPPQDPRPRVGSHRHRPGRGVRLLGRPGLQGAARGGLRGRPRQLEPATIMTDPEFATQTYVEPLLPGPVTQVIERERPDALLPTLGGQTALNLAKTLYEDGTLERFDVELIGATYEAILRAEDRELFDATMQAAGLRTARNTIATSYAEAHAALAAFGLPLIVRPAFTLGGRGGGIARSEEELRSIVAGGLAASPIGQVLIDESVLGWGEFELEVMRDGADNVVVVCSIENIDPMGVHTGDSVTVAPQQTLTDRQFQKLRDQAIAVIRAVGVETGGSNVQFAVNPRRMRSW